MWPIIGVSFNLRRESREQDFDQLNPDQIPEWGTVSTDFREDETVGSSRTEETRCGPREGEGVEMDIPYSRYRSLGEGGDLNRTRNKYVVKETNEDFRRSRYCLGTDRTEESRIVSRTVIRYPRHNYCWCYNYLRITFDRYTVYGTIRKLRVLLGSSQCDKNRSKTCTLLTPNLCISTDYKQVTKFFLPWGGRLKS